MSWKTPRETPWIGECAINILVIGYGNPGRLDDGLGPAFAEQVQALSLPSVTVESNYQLNVEDAECISNYDVVVFADASVDAAEPFEFRSMTAKAPVVGFSSHSISAESLLRLAEQLFHAQPNAYALAVRGYNFNAFGEGISESALNNLKAAVAHFRKWVVAQEAASE